MKQINLEKVHQKVFSLLLKTQKLLLDNLSKPKKMKIFSKGTEGKVTEVDVWLEKILHKSLNEIIDTQSIIGEEMTFLQDEDVEVSADGWTWIIDPIDGTNNFISGLDYFATVIALAYKQRIVAGWVFNPMKGDLFWAIKGDGAFYLNIFSSKVTWRLNNKRKNTSLEDALLATTNFRSHSKKVMKQNFNDFEILSQYCRSTRKMGSAALDLCGCAQGLIDGFWQKGLKIWDVAAPALICQEAGLKVTDYDGQDFNVFQNSIVVAPKKLHTQMLKKLQH
jgi:myo-inositol-1(or 4)-monophosphatase